MTHRFLSGLTVLLFVSLTAVADQGHQHDHGPLDLGSVGSVTFRTSCKAAVQKDFNRAVALMHSFWYAEAEKEFRRVAAADPKSPCTCRLQPIRARDSPDIFIAS